MNAELHGPAIPEWLAYWAALYTGCVLASLILHELGHALAAAAYGVEFRMGLTSVVSDGGSDARRAAIAAAGPALSLLQGMLAILLLGLVRETTWPAQFGLLMGALGLSIAFGYLLTTPFLREGDMGKVAVLLHFPLWLRILLALAGAAGVTLLARWAGPLHLALLPAEWRSLPASTAFLLAAVLPWLISVPIVAALMWPPPGWLSMLFPFFAGYYLLIAWMDGPDWSRAPLIAMATPNLPPALGFAAVMVALAAALRRLG